MSGGKERTIKPFIFHMLTAAILAGGLSARGGQAGAVQVDIEELKKSAPKIYIDCMGCDLEYIKTEITFVNYVRDRKEAHVHVLVTTQATAGGGREYTLSFLCQNGFGGVNDTVKYFANKTDTEDEVRNGLVKALKIGLAPYAARTPIASRIAVSYAQPPRPPAVEDKWDHWVFSLSGNGSFNGEQSMSSASWGLNASASRITLKTKLRIGLSGQYSRSRFDYGGATIRSVRESADFSGLHVFSLGEHWSAGFSLEASSSTFNNIRLSLRPAPAVEFNVFPYAQATRRQLRIVYRLGLGAVRYRQETIYDKTRETLWGESLSVTLDLKEKWGAISVSGSGSHYFHDFGKNRLNVFGSLQVNLFKGLNAYVIGGGSRIRDQLGLVKGTASLEEILLRRRQLETGYNYFAIFGLSYTFGSIYTNVVNPRFGSAGSGEISIHIE
ncbi:MAG: hypothetical protein FJY82_12085 [Candidatus Aminicenantes bacterium]|nr:hypothetical protein [Candidatus Aminicenantes bacterium]